MASPIKRARSDDPSSPPSLLDQLKELISSGADDSVLQALLSQHTMPRVQEVVPDFTCTALMPNKEFQDLTMSSFRGKWVVLFWYPLDFTFVCPTEVRKILHQYKCIL